MLYIHKHTSRREICSIDPVPRRCLPIPNDNGHEHITSCLFLLLVINIPLEGRIHRVVPDTYQGICIMEENPCKCYERLICRVSRYAKTTFISDNDVKSKII